MEPQEDWIASSLSFLAMARHPKNQKGGHKARRFVETFSPALGARAE